jgi:hypothetical protein
LDRQTEKKKKEEGILSVRGRYRESLQKDRGGRGKDQTKGTNVGFRKTSSQGEL